MGTLQAGSYCVHSEATQATCSHMTLAKEGQMTTSAFSRVGKDNPIEISATHGPPCSIGRGRKYFEQKCTLPPRTSVKVGHEFLKKKMRTSWSLKTEESHIRL